MKRLYNTLSIVLITLLIGMTYSCSKEELKDNAEQIKDSDQNLDIQLNYSIEDNMLVFKSVKDYESAIFFLNGLSEDNYNKFESKIGFKSMRAFYLQSNNYVNMPVEDDLFATLLNPKARIKIGDNIYEIDTKKEQVYVLSSEIYKRNGSFKSTNTSEIAIYSFDDEVLDMDNGSLKLGDNCPSFKHYHKSMLYNGQEIESVLHYMKFGIYFKLKAEINKMFIGGGGIITAIALNTDVTWKTNNESKTIQSGSVVNGSGDQKNIIFSFYSGMKPLKEWSALSIDCGWWDFTPNGQQYFRHWKSGSCN
jgi:hypothetical protein